MADRFWDELFHGIARPDPPGGTGDSTFVELREDLTAERDSRADRARVTRTWTAGVSRTRATGTVFRAVPPDGLRGVPGISADASPLAGFLPDAWLEAILQETKKLCPGALVWAQVVAFDQQVLVRGSEGRLVHDRRWGCRARLETRLGHAADAAAAVNESRLGRDLDPDGRIGHRMAAEAAERLARKVRSQNVSPGEFPLVFAPGVGGVLIHEIVGHALEGDTFHGGRSWLSRVPEGHQVGPKGLLVIDDPRRGRGGWRHDDEGTRVEATPLIRDGRVAGCLESVESARGHGRGATGHARRSSFRSPVLPRMGCTFIAAGPLCPEEVLPGIDDGIYVRRMEAASADPCSGIAVFRVTDSDRIRRGRIDAPLRPHLIRVDASRALAGLDRVANDLEFDRCIGSCVRDGQPLVTTVGGPTFRIGLTHVFC